MDPLVETDFYTRYVAPRLKTWGVHARIENVVGSGFPDIWYAINGVQGLIELKVAHNGSLDFMPTQLPWLRRAHRRGAWHLWVMALVTVPVWHERGQCSVQEPRVMLYHATAFEKVPRHIISDKAGKTRFIRVKVIDVRQVQNWADPTNDEMWATNIKSVLGAPPPLIYDDIFKW